MMLPLDDESLTKMSWPWPKSRFLSLKATLGQVSWPSHPIYLLSYPFLKQPTDFFTLLPHRQPAGHPLLPPNHCLFMLRNKPIEHMNEWIKANAIIDHIIPCQYFGSFPWLQMLLHIAPESIGEIKWVSNATPLDFDPHRYLIC